MFSCWNIVGYVDIMDIDFDLTHLCFCSSLKLFLIKIIENRKLLLMFNVLYMEQEIQMSSSGLINQEVQVQSWCITRFNSYADLKYLLFGIRIHLNRN